MIDSSIYANQEAPDILGGAMSGLSLASLMGKSGSTGAPKSKGQGSNLGSLAFSDGDFSTFYKMLQADRKYNQPQGYSLGVLPVGPNMFSGGNYAD